MILIEQFFTTSSNILMLPLILLHSVFLLGSKTNKKYPLRVQKAIE